MSLQSVTQVTTDGGVPEAENEGRTVAALDLAGHDVRSVYVHVPFCFHKCHYCDFYSIVDRRDRLGAFAVRLEAEVRAARTFVTGPVETVFFGGGTPTLLPPEAWRAILAALAECLPRAAGSEMTVEANPETVTDELVRALAAGGVDRLSIGAQSFDPRHLGTLERWHDPEAVARSVDLARDGGITNFNLDLIFGIPGQSRDEWRRDLDRALALEPTHLSCYGLTYETNTPLERRRRVGLVTPIDEDVEAAMYEDTVDRLAAAGYEQYEISNWARPGRQCRHNLAYWRNASWWALGPAACGHVAGWRWRNVPRLDPYLGRGPLPPIVEVERLDADGRAGETLMLGLRLLDGIALDRLDDLLAAGPRGPSRRAALDRHERAGLLVREDGHLRFSRRGRLLADSVLCEVV